MASAPPCTAASGRSNYRDLPRDAWGTPRIYVFQAQQGVKVGITRRGDVSYRRRMVELAAGTPVSLVASFPVEVEGAIGLIEQRAHRFLAEHRTIGEWFSCTPEVAIAAVEQALTETAEEMRARARDRVRRRTTEQPDRLTLRELRHLSDLSLVDVAEVSGLNKARISELERGVRWPTRDELTALGYVYGVELGVGFSVIMIGGEA